MIEVKVTPLDEGGAPNSPVCLEWTGLDGKPYTFRGWPKSDLETARAKIESAAWEIRQIDSISIKFALLPPGGNIPGYYVITWETKEGQSVGEMSAPCFGLDLILEAISLIWAGNGDPYRVRALREVLYEETDRRSSLGADR